MDQYLRNLMRVLAVGAAFASIPLFASVAELQPPWPPAIGYVSAALVLLASLLAWEWTRKAKRSNRRAWVLAGSLFTLIGLVLYLILYSLFVEPIPGSGIRVVRGYECNADALLTYPDQCPDLSREIFQGAEWEAYALWTRSSVTTVRVALVLAWLLFTAGLIAAVGSIVAGRKFGREAGKRGGPPAGS